MQTSSSLAGRNIMTALSMTEPDEPVVNTPIPGPKSNELIGQLSAIQNSKSVQFFGNYQKSIGNYLCDADGNMLLDTFMQHATMPLGYNHPKILHALNNMAHLKTIINRPALGMYPSSDYMEQTRNALLKIAPYRLSHITQMMCASCANENAIKAAFMYHQKRRRGCDCSKCISEHEWCSSVLNKPPGSPQLSILSFNGGYHGGTAGAYSMSCCNPMLKLDLPTFPWPIANFPKYKYPLDAHEQHNEQQDRECLIMVEELIDFYRRKSRPIVAVIIEPIQGDADINIASSSFFRKLQGICRDNSITFIMNEVQTCCGATGRFWCHEHFGLDGSPDIVTFGNKMQLGGYYATPEYTPMLGSRVFNTWFGDPSKLLLFDAILKVIDEDNLIQNTEKVGEYLKEKLHELEDKTKSQIISAVRGRGTFLNFDLPNKKLRDEFIHEMRTLGIYISDVGEKSIRLRPTLIFKEKHADLLLKYTRYVLNISAE